MTEFADANEPLVLADGTRIDPKTRKPLQEATQNGRYVQVPTHSEAVEQVTAVRRRVADLPLPPKQMNTLSVVVFYSLYGMSVEDIALATGMTVEQINTMREREEYEHATKQLVDGIVEQDRDDVRNMFARASRRAVQRLIEIADDPDSNDKDVINAINSILDRAGHRPADIVEHRHRVEGGLQIEYIRRDETQRIPTIDVTPNDGAA